jgi:hypothetical protein
MYLDAHTVLEVVQSFSVEERQSKAQQRLHCQEEQLLLPYQPHGVVVAVTNVLRRTSTWVSKSIRDFFVQNLDSSQRLWSTRVLYSIFVTSQFRPSRVRIAGNHNLSGAT